MEEQTLAIQAHRQVPVAAQASRGPGADDLHRTVGLWGATGVGVGAIVGGGILALSGVAFATAGPAAILAFALNGAIALLTACSFAQLSTAFPQDGGTYAFARKVLSVEAAFAIGWIVWFASLMAAVLYAMGFGQFALLALAELRGSPLLNGPTPFGAGATTSAAVAAIALYTLLLLLRRGGGGWLVNVGKVAVFSILICAGLWALATRAPSTWSPHLEPFLPGGGSTLLQAMGYTFIALQGFDLIAAGAGQIARPAHVIPRAMFLSLGIALAIYLPLLFITTTVGLGADESIQTLAVAHPEAIIAVTARAYLGQFGYWLVILAGIFSMLSALEANLFAASRVATAMARDRTLPAAFARTSRAGTPRVAVLLTSFIVVVVLLVLPDLGAAGAASSLIFLLSFALVHCVALLARARGGVGGSFRTPLFPLLPVVGAVCCASLAIFQAIVVPAAGVVALGWLGVGLILFLVLFARGARVVDAFFEGKDPELQRLRGRSPLLLVPIAHPDHAGAFVDVASALAVPGVGRVLLTSVVVAKAGDPRVGLANAQEILRRIVGTAFDEGLKVPETLITVAEDPWAEISRVVRTRRCEAILLGASTFEQPGADADLEALISRIDCDVVVLRAPAGWRTSRVQEVLIPVGGRGDNQPLRARLLGSTLRARTHDVTFLRVLWPGVSRDEERRARRELERLAADEAGGAGRVEIAFSDDPVSTIAERAERADLLVLGLQRVQGRKVFGAFTREVAARTTRPLLMLSHR